MTELHELHELTALEQGALVRRGEVTALELVEHYLERAHRIDDDPDTTLGAFVTLTDDRARDLARRFDTLPLTDRPASPLAGVPTAIKDLNLTAGVPTEFGSPAYAGFLPEVSDAVTLGLEAAGMISLGKTSTPEFGSPCYTEPEGRPPAVTPWDRTRMAGGSSGGAAAAVAAGLVPIAQGSDGGGSIRIPASCCGLFGLKPSRGRVSGFPTYGDPVGLGTPGSLARTVRDAAAMLDTMAGHLPGDPTWAPPPSGTFLAACDRDPGRLRIARFSEPVIAEVAVDPACLGAYQHTSTLLESLGHEVVDVPVPLAPEALPVFTTVWSVLTALSVVPLTARQDATIRPLTRWLSDLGRAVTGPQFGLAIGELRRLAAGALTALAPYDAVLTPTLAQPPRPVGAIRDDADPARDFENQKDFTPWTAAWNVTGMPAASLPLHWTDEGLPIGVMLAARPAHEELLLALCAQVEAAAPWSGRRPPRW